MSIARWHRRGLHDDGSLLPCACRPAELRCEAKIGSICRWGLLHCGATATIILEGLACWLSTPMS
jgi:hypothetical protein